MASTCAACCGALAAGSGEDGADSIMQLPTETQHDDSLIHRDITPRAYLFENAQFSLP